MSHGILIYDTDAEVITCHCLAPSCLSALYRLQMTFSHTRHVPLSAQQHLNRSSFLQETVSHIPHLPYS